MSALVAERFDSLPDAGSVSRSDGTLTKLSYLLDRPGQQKEASREESHPSSPPQASASSSSSSSSSLPAPAPPVPPTLPPPQRSKTRSRLAELRKKREEEEKVATERRILNELGRSRPSSSSRAAPAAAAAAAAAVTKSSVENSAKRSRENRKSGMAAMGSAATRSATATSRGTAGSPGSSLSVSSPSASASGAPAQVVFPPAAAQGAAGPSKDCSPPPETAPTSLTGTRSPCKSRRSTLKEKVPRKREEATSKEVESVEQKLKAVADLDENFLLEHIGNPVVSSLDFNLMPGQMPVLSNADDLLDTLVNLVNQVPDAGGEAEVMHKTKPLGLHTPPHCAADTTLEHVSISENLNESIGAMHDNPTDILDHNLDDTGTIEEESPPLQDGQANGTHSTTASVAAKESLSVVAKQVLPPPGTSSGTTEATGSKMETGTSPVQAEEPQPHKEASCSLEAPASTPLQKDFLEEASGDPCSSGNVAVNAEVQRTTSSNIACTPKPIENASVSEPLPREKVPHTRRRRKSPELSRVVSEAKKALREDKCKSRAKKHLPSLGSPARTRSKSKREQLQKDFAQRKAVSSFRVSMAAMLYREINHEEAAAAPLLSGIRDSGRKNSLVFATVARAKQVQSLSATCEGYTIHYVDEQGRMMEASTEILGESIEELCSAVTAVPFEGSTFNLDNIVIQDVDQDGNVILDSESLRTLKEELASAIANTDSEDVLNALRETEVLVEKVPTATSKDEQQELPGEEVVRPKSPKKDSPMPGPRLSPIKVIVTPTKQMTRQDRSGELKQPLIEHHHTTPKKSHIICALTPCKPASPALAPGTPLAAKLLSTPYRASPLGSRVDTPRLNKTRAAMVLTTPVLNEETEGDSLHTPAKSDFVSRTAVGTPYYTPSMTVAATEQHTPGLEYMRQELERLSGSDFSEDSMSPTRFQRKVTMEQKLLTKRQRDTASARTGRDVRKNIGLAIEQGLSKAFSSSTKSPPPSLQKTPSPKKSPPLKELNKSALPKTPSPKKRRKKDEVPPEGVPVTPGKSLAVPLPLTPGRNRITPLPATMSKVSHVIESPEKTKECGLPPTPGKLVLSRIVASDAQEKGFVLTPPKQGIPFSPLKSGTPSPNRLIIFSPGKFSQPSSVEKNPVKILQQRSCVQSWQLEKYLGGDACFKESSPTKKRKRAVLVPVPKTSPLRNAFQSNWEAKHDAHNYDQIRCHHEKVEKGEPARASKRKRHSSVQEKDAAEEAPRSPPVPGKKLLTRTHSFPPPPPPRRRRRRQEQRPLDINMELVPQLGKMACSGEQGESAKGVATRREEDFPYVLGLVRKKGLLGGKTPEAKKGSRKERQSKRRGCERKNETCAVREPCKLSDCSHESLGVILCCDPDSGVMPDVDFIVPPPSTSKSKN